MKAIYSRIKYDVFFKKIFQQEHILKVFLNTVLQNELPAPIQVINYQPTDFMTKAERQYLNMVKHTVIDVFVTTETGTRALVEIQKGTDKTDLIRFLDYQCRNFSNQFRAGDDYSQPVPCYSICWLFDMTPSHKDFQERLTFTSDKNKTNWQAQWEIIALYPACIKKEHVNHHTLEAIEEWLLLDVVTNIKKAKQIKELIWTKEVREAFEQLDISGLTEEELDELEFQSAVTDRYKDSFEKRLKQMRKEHAQEIAKNLLDVLDIETICQKTKLSKEDVEALRQTS